MAPEPPHNGMNSRPILLLRRAFLVLRNRILHRFLLRWALRHLRRELLKNSEQTIQVLLVQLFLSKQVGFSLLLLELLRELPDELLLNSPSLREHFKNVPGESPR